ncbi:MAG: hypothetical protein ACI4RA_10885 [Kiritimatiellia bacterium]
MEKVRAGETIAIKATTWNAFVDAANFVKEQRQNQSGKGLRSGIGTGIVLVKNGESELRERFAALVLNDIAVPPNANEDEFVSCPPVFIGQKMTDEREGRPYAILLEPIAPGSIGRAMVLGIVPAKVTINDADDQYAVPTPGSSAVALQSDSTGVARIVWKAGGSGIQWCLLQLGGAGGGSGGDKAYMCQVSGGSTSAGYRVTVYPNGRYDSKTTSDGILYVPELALGSELPSGAWIIGHKSALKATGGSET